MLETLPRRSERRSRSRKSRRNVVVLVVLFLIVVGGIVGVGTFYAWSTGASGPREPVKLTVPKGATGADIGELLAEKGIIRSALGFKLITRFRGLTEGFAAGKYRLKTNMTVEEAIEALKAGPVPIQSVEVTIPEGYRISEVAARVSKKLKRVDAGKFEQLAKSGKFSIRPYLPKGTATVEGFLFPSTYEFLKRATAQDVIRRLLREFKDVAQQLDWANAKALGVTPYQAVIVASMIEREARIPEDRRKVATVIYNRLKTGMPLQIDATVQYALGKQKPRLTLDDLEVQSPYNTYLHQGLPPGPIASPGKASLRAALNPVKEDWLYFVVVDDSGRHAFTESYDEFLQLKAGAPT